MGLPYPRRKRHGHAALPGSGALPDSIDGAVVAPDVRITVVEAIRLLGVGKTTVIVWTNRGYLPPRDHRGSYSLAPVLDLWRRLRNGEHPADVPATGEPVILLATGPTPAPRSTPPA